MSTTKIDAKVFKNMLNGGAAMLSLHKDELNELNVFPVADGDTGSNMSKTLEGAIAEIGSNDIKTLSKDLSSSILLSARKLGRYTFSDLCRYMRDTRAL